MARDMNPANQENWRLVCKVCRVELHPGTNMGMVAEHWNAEHADEEGNAVDEPELELEWLGIGPAPKGGPKR